MRFRLATDNPGTRGLTDGIGSMFQALAMAPLYQAQGAEQFQNAEQKRKLTDSQIGQNLAKTAIDQHKADLLKGRPDVLNLMGATRAGMSIPEFQAAIAERTNGAPAMGPPMMSPPISGVGPSGRTQALDDAILSLYGPAMATPADQVNWDQLASSRGRFQDQALVDQAAQAATGGDNMLAGALSAVRGKKEFTPFAAVGNTGTALNQVTGAQPVSNEGIRALFGDKVGSEVTENRAQANSANAAAGAHSASAGASRALAGLRGVQSTNEKVKGGITALDYEAAKEGKPLPSSNKGTSGSTSTNSKFRNQIIMAAMRRPEFGVMDPAEKQDFINTELMVAGMDPVVPGELAGLPAKGNAAAAAKPGPIDAQAAGKKIDMAAAEKVKAEFKAGKLTREQAKAKLKQLGMD